MPNCTSCGRDVSDWEQTYYDSFQVCADCYRRKFSGGGKELLCTKCMRRMGESEANRSLGRTLCQDCYRSEIQRIAEWTCASCGKEIRRDEQKYKSPDGKTLCESCAKKSFKGTAIETSVVGKCERCGKSIQWAGFPLDDEGKRIL